jgi:hypothetical protein
MYARPSATPYFSAVQHHSHFYIFTWRAILNFSIVELLCIAFVRILYIVADSLKLVINDVRINEPLMSIAEKLLP